MAINVPQVEQYIRQAAQRRGIDPDIAVRVARSEGLAPGVWQSNVVKNGQRETSYGPFQLLVGGGLGDQFIQQTGMDPRDPSTVNQQVDFALDQAAQGGWGPWYGAAKVGVDDWTGINGGGSGGDTATPGSAGYNPHAAAGNAPAGPSSTFGSMAPMASRGAGGTPSFVGEHWESLDDGEGPSFGDRLSNAGKFLDAFTPDPPRVSGGGDARSSGNALLDFMNSPTASDMLLKKRLRG